MFSVYISDMDSEARLRALMNRLRHKHGAGQHKSWAETTKHIRTAMAVSHNLLLLTHIRTAMAVSHNLLLLTHIRTAMAVSHNLLLLTHIRPAMAVSSGRTSTRKLELSVVGASDLSARVKN